MCEISAIPLECDQKIFYVKCDTCGKQFDPIFGDDVDSKLSKIFKEHKKECPVSLKQIEQEYQAALKWAKENCQERKTGCDGCFFVMKCLDIMGKAPCHWVNDYDRRIIIAKYHELKAMQESELTESQEKLHDTINQPSYYSQLRFELADGRTIQVDPLYIGDVLKLPYTVSNALKYIWRDGNKADNDETKDLTKAIECLRRRIEHIENGNQ